MKAEELTKTLFDICADSHGLSDLEAKIYQSPIFKKILDALEYKDKFEEFQSLEYLRKEFESVSISKEQFNELKEKAEKWDIIAKHGKIKPAEIIVKLEKENKRLKDSKSDWEFDYNDMVQQKNGWANECLKSEQKLQKVRELEKDIFLFEDGKDDVPMSSKKIRNELNKIIGDEG